MKKILIFVTIAVYSFAFEFNLKPIKVSENSYYVEGKEYFSPQNGGNISNSSFIITKNAVILIDTGTTVAYANELKKAIKKITPKPIKYIINTHHHPDHFLGNYAFENIDIYSTQYTHDDIKEHGELYVNNIVGLIGETAYSTRSKTPNKILKQGTLTLDGYSLDIFFFDGHTKSDTVIFDRHTKTLYVSDLIFNQRALATPHAVIQEWISSLKKLKEFDFETLVPGHGSITHSKDVIDENIRYLEFLEKTLVESNAQGLDVFEILSQEVPQEFKDYSMFDEEFERSIINLFKKY